MWYGLIFLDNNGEIRWVYPGQSDCDYIPEPDISHLDLAEEVAVPKQTVTRWPDGRITVSGTTSTPFHITGTPGYYHDDTGGTYIWMRR
jgi:hypothetical protein